jgi:hypothetical protein
MTAVCTPGPGSPRSSKVLDDNLHIRMHRQPSAKARVNHCLNVAQFVRGFEYAPCRISREAIRWLRSYADAARSVRYHAK